jgi:Na+-driven multidrug efflux pump
VQTGIFIDFLYGIIGGSLLLGLLRPYWGSLYTNDHDIDALVYRTLPIMFLYLVVDSSKCITLNVLRSTGRPFITVLGNIVGEGHLLFCFVTEDANP